MRLKISDEKKESNRKIKEKDEEIISSYTAAYNALSYTLNSRIDNLDTTKNAEPGKYIIGI